MNEPKADAIIIGSGINSLVCAIFLQSKGWTVHIIEQGDTVGGAVKSGEYTLDGFRHDWAAMNLSLFAGSPFFQQFGEQLKEHGLELVAAHHCFASVFPDGHWLGISQDPQKNANRIHAYSDKDEASWNRLTKQFSAQAPLILPFLQSPFKLAPLFKHTWQLYRKEGQQGMVDLFRLVVSSPREWLDTHFESEHVKATLAAWGMHLDFAPDIAGGAIFPFLESFANQAFGMVIGKGGADTITRAMVSLIESQGGTLEYGTRVSRVMTSQGKAIGVEKEDGSVRGANKAVIANVSPSGLQRLVANESPLESLKCYDAFRHAPGTMMIHVALDKLPNWTASQTLKEFAYVHIAPSMDHMARTYQQAMAGVLPEHPVIVVGQPTAIDPSRAPREKHTLWIQVRMLPSNVLVDSITSEPTKNWQNLAAPYCQHILNIIEQYAPGFQESILSKRVVSPADLEADNPNLVGGDQLCGSHHLNQNFGFRPSFGKSDGSTPIPGLYHTGAAVWPGAGTGAGSGYLLAQKLAK
ncbi:NAD(P)/FAD-dependent oxidoreductase [Vibrio sp. S9_S30]|uniref:phytoene desaturase family protein n=1 Tax=Vibrio sp. S9_S30 TaxID=2720226 RepID=UPI0016802B39|nr:NAD(P)/FAD-dependent oxidoreductase [Vibrio sp. S9_S30]MBD1557184.1 NAD(P)/FAD-dependent oxidoreductase [Vibrio sp. S9_S30]